MATVRLHERRVQTLKPRKHAYDVRDRELKGAGVRVLPSGAKRYFIHSQHHGRRVCKIVGHAETIGVNQAREGAKTLLASIRNRNDAQAPAPPDIAFETVADEVFRRYARNWKPSTLKVNQSCYRNQILPWFEGRPIGDITAHDVRRWFASLHDTPVAADRSAPVLSVIGRQAEVYGYRPEGTNPCVGIKRYRRQGRERFLSEPELRRLGEVLARHEASHPRAVAVIRLLLLTGCRKGEIVTLKWRFYREGMLFLPDGKTGPRTVWLSSAARDILDGLPRTSVWVFPSPQTTGFQHTVGVDKFWHRVRAEADLCDVRLHDLRHTFASHAVRHPAACCLAPTRPQAGEKARRVWADVAFEHSDSREEFLVRLNECIAHVRQKQGLTTDALIRRLRRISNVIVDDLATAEKPPGSDFGNALREFYAGPAITSGPDDRDLREESAVEFVGCLARIARLNLRAASDPELYRILTTLRGWWRPSSPPERFETLSRKVAHAGIDVLHNDARQGSKNKPLRQAIVDACGRSVVDLLSKAVVDADVSLPEDISYWFIHGTEQAGQRSTAAIEALSGKRLDEHIGRLLIANSSPDCNFRTIKAVADQVSILMPDEASTLSRAANSFSQITAWSKAIARSRDLELMGERGEIVAYDPAIHDANEDCGVGSKVVVAAPGAIRKMPGRPQVLIVKVEVRSP